MTVKEEAINEIVRLARMNGISVEQIASALGSSINKQNSRSVLVKLFSVLGTLFILSGLSVLCASFWDDMGSAMRVVITLGTGFSLYVSAIIFGINERLRTIAAPIHLLAAGLQVGGFFVLVHEFMPDVTEWQLVAIGIYSIMAIQQGLTFIVRNHTVSLFNTLFFAVLILCTGLDYIDVSNEFNSLVTGSALLVAGYVLGIFHYYQLRGLAYFFGSIFFFWASFDYLQDTTLKLFSLLLVASLYG